MRSVVVLGDFEGALTPMLAELLGDAYRVSGYHDAETDHAVLLTRLDSAQVIVVIRERTPLPSSLISQLRSLELLVTTGRGNTVVAHDGPPLLATDSMASAPVELTWALILDMARDIQDQQQRLRDGQWQNILGMGLEGRTLGLIGFGRIGQRVGRIARAFGMRVIAYSPSLTRQRAESFDVEYAELTELARTSDVISLHAKLTPESRGIVDEKLIAQMQPHALLVNTARSALVDAAAVQQALAQGRLGGLAQDVFDQEPLPAADPLRDAPRTLLTPHIGYATDQNFRLFAEHVAEDITEFYQGRVIRAINR